MYLFTQSKTGISSLELAHRLRLILTTAWKVQHKLAQVMLERAADKPGGGADKRVEMDDTYLGGVSRGGKRGRGASGTTPIVFAVKAYQRGQPAPPQAQGGQRPSQDRDRETEPSSAGPRFHRDQ